MAKGPEVFSGVHRFKVGLLRGVVLSTIKVSGHNNGNAARMKSLFAGIANYGLEETDNQNVSLYEC